MATKPKYRIIKNPYSTKIIGRYGKLLGCRFKAVIKPDAIGLPFGDLMNDDEALERNFGTNKFMYELGIIKRQEFATRPMSRKSYAKWKATISDIGDDEPLRNHI